MKQICRETLQRAYLLIDGEQVAEEESRSIRAHLEECTPCFERYGLEVEVKALISRLRGAHQCPESLKSRIAGLIEEA
ncbi:MAG TPA: mycothiol system anti-sigma-R factor [Actinomycetota bacterium]|nr:mycothiol system anti-sigma-R factor [Actinomycetota bacterium]